jgi:hypothetical protein
MSASGGLANRTAAPGYMGAACSTARSVTELIGTRVDAEPLAFSAIWYAAFFLQAP